MLPPKDQPSAPKKAKQRLRRCQSLRPERSPAARLASTPGIIAPYSWPKLPRIPQPIESESPTQRKYNGHTFVPKTEIILLPVVAGSALGLESAAVAGRLSVELELSC